MDGLYFRGGGGGGGGAGGGGITRAEMAAGAAMGGIAEPREGFARAFGATNPAIMRAINVATAAGGGRGTARGRRGR